jgi:ABC-type dipeptide/oligopeptide/nickel transport system permease component
MILPALTLGSIPLSIIMRLTRSAFLEQMGEDYLRTARAKGLNEFFVLLRHALRVAAPAIVTVVALQAGLLLSGAVLTEGLFSWPGLGKYLIDSIHARDYPGLQACILLFGLIFIFAGSLADLLCVFLDPRIRR